MRRFFAAFLPRPTFFALKFTLNGLMKCWCVLSPLVVTTLTEPTRTPVPRRSGKPLTMALGLLFQTALPRSNPNGSWKDAAGSWSVFREVRGSGSGEEAHCRTCSARRGVEDFLGWKRAGLPRGGSRAEY